MKTSIAFAFLMLLTGCSHARLEEWKNDELTTCGTEMATQAALLEKAQTHCDGTLTMIGKSRKVAGSSQFVTGISQNSYKPCATYRCDGKVKP